MRVFSLLIIIIAGIFAILYILFNLYLVIHMAACMGNQRLMNSRVSYHGGLANHKLVAELVDTF